MLNGESLIEMTRQLRGGLKHIAALDTVCGIPTRKAHSVRGFLHEAFSAGGIEDGETGFVTQDPRFLRPSEEDVLVGDYSIAKTLLEWSPKTSFHELVGLMVKNDLLSEAIREGIEIPRTHVTS